jgi:hypothetical protein
MRPVSFVTVGALALAASGVLNIFADVLPDSATPAMNLAGVALGIIGLQALWIFASPRAGRAVLAGYLLAVVGFVGIAGFLFADAFIFPALPPDQVAALVAGPAGLAIFAAVILYVAGVLVLAATLFRLHGLLPRPALLLWAVGTAPTVAAIALPAIVMTVAEITASLGLIWIALTMLRPLQVAGDPAPR